MSGCFDEGGVDTIRVAAAEVDNSSEEVADDRKLVAADQDMDPVGRAGTTKMNQDSYRIDRALASVVVGPDSNETAGSALRFAKDRLETVLDH